MNQCILLGHLGGSVELKFGASGTAIGTFSMATNERYTDRDGNLQERTEWHRVVCFGKQAENSAKYLSKGSQVLVQARSRTSSWLDAKSGEKRYRHEFIAERVQFLQPPKNAGAARQPRQEEDMMIQEEPYTNFGADEEIPF